MTARAFSLLDALRAAVSGRQKSIAREVWGDAPDADARLSRILAGELNVPPRLLDLAFRASPEPLYEWVRATFPVRVELLERPWEETLARAGRQLELFTERVELLAEQIHAAQQQKEAADLRERERIGPKRAGQVKVEARRPSDRRRA